MATAISVRAPNFAAATSNDLTDPIEREEMAALMRDLGLREGEAAPTTSMLQLLRSVKMAKPPSESRPGDSKQAQTDAPSESGEGDSDEDEEELQKALAMSLQTPAPAPAAPARAGAAPAHQNFWAPPRYVPPTLSQGERKLSLRERIECRDGSFTWQPASAFLDTGNQHMTIVDAAFAARHALYLPGGAGVYDQAERYTTVRGVVPGATTTVPVVTVALRIRGQEYTIEAAVSPMHGEDVLLGLDVLSRLFAAGFEISAGSV